MPFDLYCLFIYFSSVCQAVRRQLRRCIVQSKQMEFKQIRLADCDSGIYILKHYRSNGNLLLSIVVMISILRFRATPKDSEPCFRWRFVLRSSNTSSRMKLHVSNGLRNHICTFEPAQKAHPKNSNGHLSCCVICEPFVLITEQLIGVCLWCTDFVHPFRNVRTILSPHKSSPSPFQTRKQWLFIISERIQF